MVFALMGILSPERFLSAQNLTSMAFQFPEFAILALAMTLAMMTGGIDLSVVGIANLSAVIAALILTEFADPGLSFRHHCYCLALPLVCRYSSGLSLVCLTVPGCLPWLATNFSDSGSGLVFTGLAIALTGGSAVMGFPEVVSGLAILRCLVSQPSAHFYCASRGFAHSYDTYSLWFTNLHVRYQSLGSTVCRC